MVDYTHFLSGRVYYVVKDLDPQLPVVPEDYWSFTGYEPLPFLGTRLWLSGYGYFNGQPLTPCDHPTEWIVTKGEDMSNSKGKGIPSRCSSQEYEQVWKMI